MNQMSDKFFFLKTRYTKGDYYIEEYNNTMEQHDLIDIFNKLPVKTHYGRASGKNLTDFISGHGLASGIVSGRLKEILLELDNVEMQFLPAKIDRRGKYLEDYWLFNLMSTIACVDFEKSDCDGDEDEPELWSVEKLMVKKEVMAGNHLFRFREMKNMIIVSEELRQTLKENKIKGLWYMPLENFEFPRMPGFFDALENNPKYH